MASKIPFETLFNPFASLVGVLKYNNLPTGEISWLLMFAYLFVSME